MEHSVHNKLVSFIWNIADDSLRDVYVRGKFRDVILPIVVLRRLDTLLEPTKEAVLEEVRFQQQEMNAVELTFEKIMREVMLERRKDELELYKLFANDPAFKASLMLSAQRMVGM
ncbi:type I restriction-modification system subunit M N-terminal domain-containing protein [Aeromonas dhakensis]|uniref:type I restriction-modification system subunit M N-terminal domain-containing protein n=1 Tax=Aeromonas dhakensis TaxID=196024 RepID=UPI0021576F49|nr:type I restriction-modification system subunit M N-terminal domain-containing protein [Aeromonas dhakensis]MCR6741058.1 type I restriction-modification system subunit M N-terminal domain-containing protein [Aeromonas dhakensis]